MKYESSETQYTRKIQRTMQKNEKLRTVKNTEKKIYVTFSKLKLNESILFPKKKEEKQLRRSFFFQSAKISEISNRKLQKGRRQYERVGVWVEGKGN